MTNENVDELGYSRVLLMDIENCSRLYGSEQYRMAVSCLRHDVLNLRDGPRLHDITEEFVRGEWNKGIEKDLDAWKEENFDLKDDPFMVQDEEEKITDDHSPFSLLTSIHIFCG